MEKPLAELRGVGLGLSGGGEMKRAEPLEDPAGVAVGIVDQLAGPLHCGGGVLGELEDRVAVSVAQEIVERVDGRLDTGGVGIRGTVVDEITRVGGLVDGIAEGGEIESRWPPSRHLLGEALAQPLVDFRLAQEQLDKNVLGLCSQVRADVVHGDRRTACARMETLATHG